MNTRDGCSCSSVEELLNALLFYLSLFSLLLLLYQQCYLCSFFSLPFSCVSCVVLCCLVSSVCPSICCRLSASSSRNLHQTPKLHKLAMPSPNVNFDTQLKPNAEQQHSTRLRSGAPPARPPPPTLPASQPAAYYNHPYAPNTNTSNGSNSTRGNPYPINNLKPPRHTSTPTKVRPLASTDSSFDNPPDMQSPPIPPRRQCSANAVVAATAAAVSAGINRLERNCWQDEQNNSMRSSNNSSASSASASSSSSCASFVTAASRFSQLNISSPQSSDSAPIPTPRAKREVQHRAARLFKTKNRPGCGITPPHYSY